MFRYENQLSLLVGFAGLLLPLLSVSAFAKEFCVSNAEEFQAALDEAATNGEDDVIKLVQGTYVGNFKYNAPAGEAEGLCIEGGYTPGCTSRELDPLNTILDGGGEGTVLDFQSNGLEATPDTRFKVEGVTVQNGHLGLDLLVLAAGEVLIRKNILFNHTKGGAAVVRLDKASVTFDENIISENNNVRGADEHVARTGGVFAHVSTKGSITFTDNEFSFNNGFDGAVKARTVEGDIRFNRNRMIENQSQATGGAADLEAVDGDIDFADNLTKDNTAKQGGGGVQARVRLDHRILVSNNDFINNDTDGNGGALNLFSEKGQIRIIDNEFIENDAGKNGGGFDAFSATGDIENDNNLFQTNSAQKSGGGGRAHTNGATTFQHNSFIENEAGEDGGGADVFSDPEIQKFIQNLFDGNRAGRHGGGLNSDDKEEEEDGTPKEPSAEKKDILSLNNEFRNNTAGSLGGGANFEFRFATLNLWSDNYTGNKTTLAGGGASFTLAAGDVTVGNTVFVRNSSETFGGGASFNSGGFVKIGLMHDTFTENQAWAGGGIESFTFGDDSTFSITNTIISSNTAEGGADDVSLTDDRDGNGIGTEIIVRNTIFGELVSVCANTPDCDSSILIVDSMVGQNPFTRTKQADGDVDIRLSPGSIAIDAGDPNVEGMPETDFEGDPRVVDGDGDGVALPDIGADEFVGTTSPEPTFRRGDSDGDGLLSVGDAIVLLDFMFLGLFDPLCRDAMDFNDDSKIDTSDPIGSLRHQFLGEQPPAAPGMETCGVDPTEDGLDCEVYPADADGGSCG